MEQLSIFKESELEFAERTALSLIREFEPVALERSEFGYVVGYSGGRDSDCLVHLFIKSGVKFCVIHNHTTLDLPETVYYIRERFKYWRSLGIKCDIYYRSTFWKVCRQHKMLPFRRKRFCCSELKEYQPIPHAVYSFGVRRAESSRRKQNRDSIEMRNRADYKDIQKFHFDSTAEVKQIGQCFTHNYVFVNPIAYWSTKIRDKYIKREKITINYVYEKYGLTRCGCVCCCMGSDKQRQQEEKLFPVYAKNIYKLCERIVNAREQSRMNAQQLYDFYFGRNNSKKNKKELDFFELLESEEK